MFDVYKLFFSVMGMLVSGGSVFLVFCCWLMDLVCFIVSLEVCVMNVCIDGLVLFILLSYVFVSLIVEILLFWSILEAMCVESVCNLFMYYFLLF